MAGPDSKESGPGGGGGGGASGGSNPRKFSEKIALHKQREAEEKAAFDEMMKQIRQVKGGSGNNSGNSTQTPAINSDTASGASNGLGRNVLSKVDFHAVPNISDGGSSAGTSSCGSGGGGSNQSPLHQPSISATPPSLYLANGSDFQPQQQKQQRHHQQYRSHLSPAGFTNMPRHAGSLPNVASASSPAAVSVVVTSSSSNRRIIPGMPLVSPEEFPNPRLMTSNHTRPGSSPVGSPNSGQHISIRDTSPHRNTGCGPMRNHIRKDTSPYSTDRFPPNHNQRQLQSPSHQHPDMYLHQYSQQSQHLSPPDPGWRRVLSDPSIAQTMTSPSHSSTAPQVGSPVGSFGGVGEINRLRSAGNSPISARKDLVSGMASNHNQSSSYLSGTHSDQKFLGLPNSPFNPGSLPDLHFSSSSANPQQSSFNYCNSSHVNYNIQPPGGLTERFQEFPSTAQQQHFKADNSQQNHGQLLPGHNQGFQLSSSAPNQPQLHLGQLLTNPIECPSTRPQQQNMAVVTPTSPIGGPMICSAPLPLPVTEMSKSNKSNFLSDDQVNDLVLDLVMEGQQHNQSQRPIDDATISAMLPKVPVSVCADNPGMLPNSSSSSSSVLTSYVCDGINDPSAMDPNNLIGGGNNNLINKNDHSSLGGLSSYRNPQFINQPVSPLSQFHGSPFGKDVAASLHSPVSSQAGSPSSPGTGNTGTALSNQHHAGTSPNSPGYYFPSDGSAPLSNLGNVSQNQSQMQQQCQQQSNAVDHYGSSPSSQSNNLAEHFSKVTMTSPNPHGEGHHTSDQHQIFYSRQNHDHHLDLQQSKQNCPSHNQSDAIPMEGFFNFGPGDTLDNNDSPFSNEGARGAANSSQSQQKGGCPAGGGGSSTGAPHTPQTPSSIPDIILTDVDDGTGTGLQNSEINLSFEEADLSANLGDLTKLDDDSMIRLLDFENQEDPTLSTTRTPTTTASD